jgi:hypothetical protein
MDERPQISFRPFLVSTILLALSGWGGLALLLNYTLPTLAPRWGFYALLVLGLVGTALPIVWFLNLRFRRKSEPAVVLRQALWAGVYGSTLAWLQMGRILNISIAFGLALGFAVIEYVILLREQSTRP